MIEVVDSGRRPGHWHIDVNVPAEKAWALLADFKSITGWWPEGLRRVDFIGDGIGMIRNVYSDIMEPFCQRLDAINHGNMVMEMTLLNTEQFGIETYKSSMNVQALDDQTCRVTFTGMARTFEAEQHEALLVDMEAFIDSLLTSIKNKLETDHPA